MATVRVLGPLELEVDGRVVPVGSARQRAVLAALVMQAREVVSIDRLASAAWGERLPQHPTHSLRTLIARLRKALCGAASLLGTHPAGYVLALADTQIDARLFEARYDAARQRLDSDPAGAAQLLDAALALWRGDAYDELADGHARPEATRLEQLRLCALEERAATGLRLGALDEAVAAASALAAEHPLRERPVALLMRGLHAAGRTGDALVAYQQHRTTVADDLGLDPSPALRRLQGQILRDEVPHPTAVDERGRAAHERQAPGPAAPAPQALPWRPSPLIDRASELGMLRDAVTTTPLITLTGPGGVGKTRLALEVAHMLRAGGHQVWWADLAAVTSGRLVAALAEATGVELRQRRDPAGALCDTLAAQRGLLCIDNAEHVLDALAPIIERLLDATTSVTLLITSRERLAVDAETLVVVPPLPLPSGPDRDNPAVRLFVERSPALRDHHVSDDEVDVVARLCRRLDGLPLAIELAAAQAGMLGPRVLLERLGQRLDLLRGGRRTAATRHRTLRAVVDWSHDLLTGDEARLLARLAAFPAAFTLGRVESVCSDSRIGEHAAAALLARLVEQSLVQSAHGRFWMLETIHRYAQERLDASGESLALRSRHAHDTADRLAALSARLWTSHEAAAVRDLTALVADLHAAWEHARAHDRPLAVRLAADIFDFAYFRQRIDLLEWGTSVAEWDIEHPCTAGAMATAAAAAWITGRLDDARRYTRPAVIARGDDRPAVATALDVAADLAMFQNRTEEAVAAYSAAAAAFHASGNPVRGLCTEIGVAHALAYAGRLDEAEDAMGDLIARAHGTGNPTTLALAYFVIGEAATAGGDLTRAADAYAVSIEYGNEADNRLLVTVARSASAAVERGAGAQAHALEGFAQALDEFEALGNRSAAHRTLLRTVTLLIQLGAPRAAAVLAGAVRASTDRYPLLRPDRVELEAALRRIRTALGHDATARALRDGAGLSEGQALARARHALHSARALPVGAVAAPREITAKAR